MKFTKRCTGFAINAAVFFIMINFTAHSIFAEELTDEFTVQAAPEDAATESTLLKIEQLSKEVDVNTAQIQKISSTEIIADYPYDHVPNLLKIIRKLYHDEAIEKTDEQLKVWAEEKFKVLDSEGNYKHLGLAGIVWDRKFQMLKELNPEMVSDQYLLLPETWSRKQANIKRANELISDLKRKNLELNQEIERLRQSLIQKSKAKTNKRKHRR